MADAVSRLLDAAHGAGCPPDQVRAFLEAGIVLHPRQLLASAACRLCDLPGGPVEIGAGGARGGGKSHWMLAQIGVDDCQRFPGLKCLLLRKVGKANKENFEDIRLKVFRTLPHRYNRQEGALIFENGSRIILGHYQNESDIDAYLGLEYDVIGIEEATTLTEEKYKSVWTCNRTSKPGWRPRMYTTTNPGGIGHAWYKLKFVAPWRKGEETKTRFIPFTVDDNPLVNAENKDILEQLSGWQLRAWRYGDWDIESGQFFDEWNESKHVCDPFLVPRHWEFFGGIDYGTTATARTFAFGLFAANEHGDVFGLEELYLAGTLPSEQADLVQAVIDKYRPLTKPLIAFDWANTFPPSNPLERIGEYPVEAYWRKGLNCVRAVKDRKAGWTRLKEFLHGERIIWGPDGEEKGRVPIFRLFRGRMDNTIRTIPLLIHDEKDPEDVDTTQEDHLADMDRYALMTRPKPAGPDPDRPKAKDNRPWWMKQGRERSLV